MNLNHPDSRSPMFLNAGLLYLAHNEGHMTIYDISERQIIAIFKAESAITSVTLSADGQHVYVYSVKCKLFNILVDG